MITCTFKQITIADLFNGFVNNEEEGVYTHIRIDGELIKTNIRPPYQREFVYSDVKRNKTYKGIIKSVKDIGIFVTLGNIDGLVPKSHLPAEYKAPNIPHSSKPHTDVIFVCRSLKTLPATANRRH